MKKNDYNISVMQPHRTVIVLLWIVRVATVGLTLFVLYYVFNLYFFPSGKLDVAYNFSENSEYISRLGPWQRVQPPEKIDGVWSQALKDDLVYFDVSNPRWFQTITVQVKFKNTEQPLFELGARVNNKDGYYTLPLQNRLIDGLPWARIQEGPVTLWQKNKRYDTIADWNRNMTDNDKIGTYYYKYQVDRLIPDYVVASEPTVIDHALRGNNTLYTYIKNEPLDFRFTKTDLNKYAGPDPVNIDVYRQITNERIYRQVIAGDGDAGFGAEISQAQESLVQIPDLPEGVYRIEITGNNDYILNSITTRQKYVVFAKGIFPADNEEYIRDFVPGSRPTTLLTDSPSVTFKTSHPAGLQQITAAGQKINIDTVNTFYGVQLTGLSEITLPRNDVQVEGNGLFAFSKSQYFYPFPLNVTSVNAETDIESLDYVISNYSLPLESNGWLTKTQTFDINNLYRDDEGKIRFRFSAPGLNQRGATVRVAEIRVVFEKPPLTWANLQERLKNYLIKTIKKN